MLVTTDAERTVTTMTVQINLTPSKLEQLRAIQSYSRNADERNIEELATELLSDAIRAKYNYLTATDREER